MILEATQILRYTATCSHQRAQAAADDLLIILQTILRASSARRSARVLSARASMAAAPHCANARAVDPVLQLSNKCTLAGGQARAHLPIGSVGGGGCGRGACVSSPVELVSHAFWGT